MGLVELFATQYGELAPGGMAELPAYALAFLAAYPAMLLAIWVGSSGVRPRPRAMALLGVTAWAYLGGVALPLCWGALIAGSP